MPLRSCLGSVAIIYSISRIALCLATANCVPRTPSRRNGTSVAVSTDIGSRRSRHFMTPTIGKVRVGTAGWSIPRATAESFPGDGSHLSRYASVMSGVEINTSFYRSHRPEVYERWAAQTPRAFRFAVKLPRVITHDQRPRAAREPLSRFLEEISGLGERLGVLLVQLPPSLVFRAAAGSHLLRPAHGHARWTGRVRTASCHLVRTGPPTGCWSSCASGAVPPIPHPIRRQTRPVAGSDRTAMGATPSSTTAGTGRLACTTRPTARTGCSRRPPN